MKRQPTMCDKFIATRFTQDTNFVELRAVEAMQRAARQARKFVFDEDAARRLAHVVITIPELLVREHQFARPPFDLTWIEFPSAVYWSEFRRANPKAYADKGLWGYEHTADKEIGYLFDHGRINTIVNGTVSQPDSGCWVSPMQYRLNTEWPFEQQLEFAQIIGLSRAMVDAFLWGSTYNHLDENERRLLRAYNCAEIVPMTQHHRQRMLDHPGVLHNVAVSSAGDLRTIIALLLMLNRPSITRYVTELPNSRGWLRNRVIPYMAHTHVTIDLDAVPTLRKISDRSSGVELRAHEVRGHYCHDKTARDYARMLGCIHEFHATDEDWKVWRGNAGKAEHWLCGVCGGKRWWRKDHTRGNASLGFVKHDNYEVTT